MVHRHYDQNRPCRTEVIVEEQPMQKLVSPLVGESGTTVESRIRQDSTTVLSPGNVATSSELEQSTVPMSTSTNCELHRYPACVRRPPDRLEL